MEEGAILSGHQDPHGLRSGGLQRIRFEKTSAPERVTISTDAQAAIRRMASEELGPNQVYALQANEYIAVMRRARPDITNEIRRCPPHKGVTGNEKADEWAKLAAEEPDAQGVEQRGYLDQAEARTTPLP